MPLGRPPLPLEVRFWRRVNKDGPLPHDEQLGNCWLFTLKPQKTGYVQLKHEGRPVLAHRISWLLHYGQIPPGLMVLHHCDVRACIRPTHLFLGTHEDNMRDMVTKGRAAKGERSGARLHSETRPRGDAHYARRNPELLARGDEHPRRKHPELWAGVSGPRKLTRDQVEQIRLRFSNGESKTKLGSAFGVDRSTIAQVVTGRTWR